MNHSKLQQQSLHGAKKCRNATEQWQSIQLLSIVQFLTQNDIHLISLDARA